MALIKIIKSHLDIEPGAEVRAAPVDSVDGRPGWLVRVLGMRVFLREAEAERIPEPALAAVVKASLTAWIKDDGRTYPDLAEAIWGHTWDLDKITDPKLRARTRSARRNECANRIRQTLFRGWPSAAVATALADQFACSVPDLLFGRP